MTVNCRSHLPTFSRSEKFFPAFLLVSGCVVFVGALIFRDFLFGGSVLLYKDVGRDSLDDSYPWFVQFSDYLRQEGFPSWSFSVGIGQDILYLAGYFFWEPVVWLPRAFIANALVYEHLAKSLAAGLIFFSFLRLHRLAFEATLLGALLIAFSAYMCMGSCWFVLADEVVAFTAVLLAAEWALQRGQWLWLSLAVAAVGLISAFHLYLCALLLCFYVPARLWVAGRNWRQTMATSFALAGAAFLGVGISAALTLPNLITILNSPRGSGLATAADKLKTFPIFGLESRAHYVTAAARFLGNDLLGVGDQYHGWQNYFEAPIIYCGLISVILQPQALLAAKERARAVLALFFVAALLPTLFPWLRYLFWFFQGDYYRTYCLFAITGVIAMAMMALSHFKQGGRINLWLLSTTAVMSIAILHLPGTDKSLAWGATFFLGGLTVVLFSGQLFQRRELATWGVLILSAIELIRFDFVTVSDRDKITAGELQQRVGYNGDAVEAIRDIKSSDPNFFRITKLEAAYPQSYGLNDAMVFGYYGTAAYNSFNNGRYIDFLVGLDEIPAKSESDTRWCSGVTDDLLLSIFMCEKYALVEDPAAMRKSPFYKFVRKYEHQYLFRNAECVPLGPTFDRYLPEDAFLKMSSLKKRNVLLRGVTVKNEEQAHTLGLTQLAVSDVESEITNASLDEVVLPLRRSSLQLESFRPSQIVGKVQLSRKGIMVVQTPFDEGWHAFEDDRAVTVLPVDIGLLGVALDSGEHRVVLRYRNHYLLIGTFISLASLICLALGMLRWPRLDLAV